METKGFDPYYDDRKEENHIIFGKESGLSSEKHRKVELNSAR